MSRPRILAALPWLAPLGLLPLAFVGLELWQGQAASIWLAGFFAACL